MGFALPCELDQELDQATMEIFTTSFFGDITEKTIAHAHVTFVALEAFRNEAFPGKWDFDIILPDSVADFGKHTGYVFENMLAKDKNACVHQSRVQKAMKWYENTRRDWSKELSTRVKYWGYRASRANKRQGSDVLQG